MPRCAWCEKDDLYREYHDREWGKPVYDDGKLFEFILLESFQAGLSWHTIFKKRENFRKAFDQFDYHKIAGYKDDKIQELLEDKGIIRNRLKILATINNAQRFIEIQNTHGSFSSYLWTFMGGKPQINYPSGLHKVPATTKKSDEIASDLKKKGFKFMGSTVVYAHMQACGLVCDHLVDCPSKGSH